VGGLIDSARLFTAAQTTAKERRTIAEVTPYCTQLFPESDLLKEICKVSVQRNLLADLRHKNAGFTQDGLDDMAFEERKFMRLAKGYIFNTLFYIDEFRVLKFVAVRVIRSIRRFYAALSPAQKTAYGILGTPKFIYTLEYSRLWARVRQLKSSTPRRAMPRHAIPAPMPRHATQRTPRTHRTHATKTRKNSQKIRARKNSV